MTGKEHLGKESVAWGSDCSSASYKQPLERLEREGTTQGTPAPP